MAIALAVVGSLERFRAKRVQVRVKKTRQNKKLEPGFDSIKGGKALARLLFVEKCREHHTGTAGGVYQWSSIGDARAFYTEPWLDGIVERYGNYPQIEYFTTFAVCDARTGEVDYTEPKAAAKAAA